MVGCYSKSRQVKIDHRKEIFFRNYAIHLLAHQSNVHGRLIGVHNSYCNMKYKIDCLPIVSFGMGQEYPYELD